jgi:hypothetical protein
MQGAVHPDRFVANGVLSKGDVRELVAALLSAIGDPFEFLAVDRPRTEVN